MIPNEELAALAARHPRWQVWRVDPYIGAPVWCARPWGATAPVLNADRPEYLSEYIREREWQAEQFPAQAAP